MLPTTRQKARLTTFGLATFTSSLWIASSAGNTPVLQLPDHLYFTRYLFSRSYSNCKVVPLDQRTSRLFLVYRYLNLQWYIACNDL